MMLLSQESEKDQPKIIVVGGGIAGVSTALKMAKEGYKVVLVESRDELMVGTSNNTPCRVGAGLHYVDVDTAREYLRNTVLFLREYSEFLLTTKSSLEGSDYAILSDSMFDYSQIAPAHIAVIDEYKKLIQLDPKNKVLGEPNELIKFQPDTPKYIKKSVTLMKTSEQTLDWPKLRKYLINKVNETKSIRVLLKQEVKSFINNKEEKCKIICKGGKIITGDLIVNCTWQNIEKLNKTLGHFYVNRRTCRLKAMVEIILPEHLRNIRTTFFCFGPHCAITNLGNGRAFLTYEPLTNMAKTTEIEMPEDINFWLLYGTNLSISELDVKTNAKSLIKYNLGIDIIKNANKYIEGIEEATLVNISFGIVKTPGEVNIYSKDSKHHSRSQSGVSSLELNVLVNESMKLLYGVSNSIKIEELVKKHLFFEGILKFYIEKNKKKLNWSTDKQNAVYKYVTQYYSGFFSINLHESHKLDSLEKLSKIKDKSLLELEENRLFLKSKALY